MLFNELRSDLPMEIELHHGDVKEKAR